jgi:hypothetical protein
VAPPADQSLDHLPRRVLEALRLQRHCPAQQRVQEHAQRVDIRWSVFSFPRATCWVGPVAKRLPLGLAPARPASPCRP